MKHKKVWLPRGISSPRIEQALSSPLGVVTTNWINQGLRFMTPAERIHRLVCESFLIFLFSILLCFLTSPGPAILLSLLLAHTSMWLLNGHFYALLRYLRPHRLTPKEFADYIELMADRLERHGSLIGAAGFGSLSKGKFSQTSDFDLRLIRGEGLRSAFFVGNICFSERFRAFFCRFPLDAYIVTREEFAIKTDGGEPAIDLIGRPEVFSNHPAGIVELSTFLTHLRSLGDSER